MADSNDDEGDAGPAESDVEMESLVEQPFHDTNNGSFHDEQCRCPREHDLSPAGNAHPNHKAWYDDVSRETLQNLTSYLRNFRHREFDNWGKSYEEVKAGMLAWKLKHYAPYLQSNRSSSIYESACGIGLNLFMTLEILERFNVTNLTVYGNEYVPESVHMARQLFARYLPGHARTGQVCAADSAQIATFVPQDSFDLVFTGYISPLIDPLQLKLPQQSDLDRRYFAICEAQNGTADAALRERAQRAQERWYEQWVTQMIHIAKPGAPVIVEQVSYPLCEAYFDWGGVNEQFWQRTLRTSWRDLIDASSFVTERDVLYRKRYHVFMRKKAATFS